MAAGLRLVIAPSRAAPQGSRVTAARPVKALAPCATAAALEVAARVEPLEEEVGLVVAEPDVVALVGGYLIMRSRYTH